MYPELISIGNFSISSFGAMMALCFLAGYWIITVEAKRKNLDQRVVGNMFLAAMFGGIVGAKLLYVFENVPLSEILANPGASLLSRGGLTFYGGFFGAAAGVLLLALFLRTGGVTLAHANATKNVVLGAANGVAALVFAVVAPVHWPAVTAMGVGCLIGSRLGPIVVRHAPATPLRLLIAVAGLALAVKLGFDTYR